MPAALKAFVALVVVEAVAMIGYALATVVYEATSGSGEYWQIVATVLGTLGLWGALLLVCARALARGRRWAHGPVVFTQLFLGFLALTNVSRAAGLTRVVLGILVVLAVAGLVLAYSAPVRDAVGKRPAT